tara:strand:- start:9046 stop:9978 length:933 start_codon:yes stop_codon:yes gene_type:complete
MSKEITPMKRLSTQFKKLRNVLERADFNFVQLNQKREKVGYDGLYDKGVQSDSLYLFRNRDKYNHNGKDLLRIGFSFSYLNDDNNILPIEKQKITIGITEHKKETDYIDLNIDDFKHYMKSFIGQLQNKILENENLTLNFIKTTTKNVFFDGKKQTLNNKEINEKLKSIIEKKLENVVKLEDNIDKYRLKAEDTEYKSKGELRKNPKYKKLTEIQEEIKKQEEKLSKLKEIERTRLRQVNNSYKEILNNNDYDKFVQAKKQNESKLIIALDEVNQINEDHLLPFNIIDIKDQVREKIESKKIKKQKNKQD